MKTKFTSKETAEKTRKWVLIDAEGLPVGRVASKAALMLRGKHKVSYTPNQNCGDFVVVVNASKAIFTGNKLAQKKYYDYSGFVGGHRVQTAAEVLERKPEDVIRRAVKGMIPQTPLGFNMLAKLKIFSDAEHGLTAQAPKEVKVS